MVSRSLRAVGFMNTTKQAHTFYVTQGLGNSIKPILLASQSSLPGCEANVNVLDGNSSIPSIYPRTRKEDSTVELLQTIKSKSVLIYKLIYKATKTILLGCCDLINLPVINRLTNY